MSSVITDVECPRCEYKEASRDYNCRNFSNYIICHCCGYIEDESINFEKSKLPDVILWETKIVNGKGSYIYSTKDSVGFATGVVLDDTVSYLKNKIDNFRTCKYTFQMDERWFIKDLLSGEVIPFSTDLYWGYDQSKHEEIDIKNTPLTIGVSEFDSDW